MNFFKKDANRLVIAYNFGMKKIPEIGLSTTEVAEMLSVNRATVKKNASLLGGVRVGRDWRFFDLVKIQDYKEMNRKVGWQKGRKRKPSS